MNEPNKTGKIEQLQSVSSRNKIITTPRHITLIERAASYNGKLVVSPEINWGQPVGRELW